MTPGQSAERLIVGPRMTNAEIVARLSETTGVLHDLAISHAANQAAFESHRRHCDTEKAEIKAELKSINGRIVAVLIFTIINLIGISGYLLINGQPWIKEAHAQAGIYGNSFFNMWPPVSALDLIN